MKRHKKSRKLPALFSLLAVLLFFVSACGDWSLDYSITKKSGPWEFALDPDGHKAFAASYVWDGSDEGRRIVIPDEIEGCTVFKLGGYFGRGLPMPFCIGMPLDETAAATTADPSADTASQSEAQTAARTIREEELVFTLVFGKNLTEIGNIMDSADHIVDEPDGTRVIYHPVFVFEVDENNPAFYAEDGKLYKKGHDEAPVIYFDYPSETAKESLPSSGSESGSEKTERACEKMRES